MKILKAIFVTSASKLEECPESSYPEFAVVGRSNVGKSTLINMLTNQSNLAKASDTPGKTQLMNFFLINDSWCLVDLPGYGYAKSSMENREKWMRASFKYFTERKNLRRLFVLIDGNLSPQKIDMEYIQALEYSEIPWDIIITKIDKSKEKDINKNIKALQQNLKLYCRSMPKIFLSSSNKKKGGTAILDYIEEMMD